ncbi:hypothetical protein [Desulfobacula sp.]|uniref:hypothetical protein n=1 Tax=Desulfobacula sp. TaxID=2593537 RepID=UPI00261879FB|nr:hypothetical protein [Desulfobacula sp.]
MNVPEFKNIEEMQAFLDQEKTAGATIIQPSDLTPVSYYRPVVECVMLDADDVYCAQKKFRVKYSGLTKLGNAAGVEWLPDDTCRTDNRSDKMYVSFRAVGGIRKNDGRIYPMKAEYDLDLEIIAEEIRDSYMNKRDDKYNKNKSDKEFSEYAEFCIKRDVIQKRKRKLTLAESGAKARVLRSILGIKSQYENINLVVNMPFYVVRFVLDHNNPDIKSLFLRVAERSMAGLYGEQSTPKTLPIPNDVAETIDLDPEPGPEPDELPTEREQFIAYDAHTQGSILLQLSGKVEYDIDNFLKQSKVSSPDQLSETKRLQFYDFLTEGD